MTRPLLRVATLLVAVVLLMLLALQAAAPRLSGQMLGYITNRFGNRQLRFIDLRSGVEQPPYDRPHLNVAAFDWSPTCDQVAFTATILQVYDIYIGDIGSPVYRKLYTSRSFIGSPRWSPSGTHILFTEPNRRGFMDIKQIDLATGRIDILIGGTAGEVFAVWNPDGERVLYTDTASGQTDLYTIDVASGERTQLTDDAAIERSPAYAPDGQQIAFTRVQGSSQQIRLLHLPTGEQTVVVDESAVVISPTWSPDGSRLAYAYGFGRIGDFNLRQTRLDTGTTTRLTSYNDWNVYPVWSPCR